MSDTMCVILIAMVPLIFLAINEQVEMYKIRQEKKLARIKISTLVEKIRRDK